MATTTARELIRRALRGIGVIQVGQDILGEVERDALADLNDMLDSWSLEQFNIVTEIEEAFTLTSAKASYSIGNQTGTHTGSTNAAALTDKTLALETNAYVNGTVVNDTDGSSGTITANTATTVTATLAGGTDNNWDTGDAHTLRGDLNGQRPLNIKQGDAFIRSSGSDYELDVVTLDVYRDELTKTTASRPYMLAYRPSYPLGLIYLYPTPNATDSLRFRSRVVLSSFATLSTQIDLSPGYREAIINNFMIKLSIPHNKPVSLTLRQAADKSLRAVKMQNASIIEPLKLEELSSMFDERRGQRTILTG